MRLMNELAYAAWQEAVVAAATAADLRANAIPMLRDQCGAPDDHPELDSKGVVAAYLAAATAAAKTAACFEAICTAPGVHPDAYFDGATALASMNPEKLEAAAALWRRVCDNE